MIYLLNGNLIKYPQTNWKHFSVSDPMGKPIVNREQNLPISVLDVDPYLIHHCLGWPHAPPLTAVPTVHELSHSKLRRKTHWLQWGAPHSPPKVPLPWTDPQTKLPASSLDPTDLLSQTAYPISRFATMHSTGQTDTQTNRWLEGMLDDCRSLLLYLERRHGL